MVNRKQIFCIIAGCGHHFLAGAIIAWTSTILPKLLNPELNPFGRVLTEYELAMINFMTLTAFGTLLLSGPAANTFGRKPVLTISASVRVLTWLITAFNQNIYLLYLMKFVEALAIGFTYSIALVFISEIASVNIRGFALTCVGLSQNLGVLVFFSVGPFVSYRTVALIACVFSIIVFTMLLFVPETPMFYLLKGEKLKAKESILILNSENNNVERELEQFEVMIKSDAQYKQTSIKEQYKELFFVKKNVKVFLITLIVYSLPEFSGMTACQFHLTDIFQSSGSSISPHIASIIVAAIQVLTSLLSSILVERVGRKKLMLTSLSATCVINLLMGVIFYLKYVNSYVVQYITWLPLGNMILFILFYFIGLGTVPGTLLGELLDPKVKSIGTSIVASVACLCLNLTVSMFRIMNSVFGNYTTFWIFASCCALGTVFVKIFIPETKGKTYAEIQKLLD